MMTNEQSHFTYKQIWKMSFPILVSLLMEQIIGMTDTVFLGRVGEVELGASAIAAIFYIIFFMIAFGFSIGAQILIARRNGEKKYKKIGNIVYQGIYFQLGLALLLYIICMVCGPCILKTIISSERVYEASIKYLDWRIIGMFFSFTAIMFRSFFIGISQTKILTANSLAMMIANILLDYVLIFGKFGFPELGIAGAAIASSLANLVSMLFFIIYTKRHVNTHKYGLNRIPRLHLPTLRRILNVSFWTMIQNFFSVATWFLFFIYMEHLGERALAVTNIIRSISGILYMISAAFGSTCAALVSNQIGAGAADGVERTIHQHIKFTFAIIIPTAILMAIFPDTVLSIYTDMDDLRAAAIPSLWVLCTSFIFTVPGNIYFQATCGTGNTKTAMMIEIVSLVFYTSYITLIVYFHQCNVAFAWTSEHVYSIALLAICYIYIKKGGWKTKKI